MGQMNANMKINIASTYMHIPWLFQQIQIHSRKFNREKILPSLYTKVHSISNMHFAARAGYRFIDVMHWNSFNKFQQRKILPSLYTKVHSISNVHFAARVGYRFIDVMHWNSFNKFPEYQLENEQGKVKTWFHWGILHDWITLPLTHTSQNRLIISTT